MNLNKEKLLIHPIMLMLNIDVYVQIFLTYMSRLFNFVDCCIRFFFYKLAYTQSLFLIEKELLSCPVESFFFVVPLIDFFS